jgi:DNA-binding MarR family transcriptional regulator
MDTQELRTLKLFEEIENEKAPSQRDLATSLNISLGLVNSFMKRLTQKGFFKITNIPKNRARYILTPKGAAEKSRLTYEYIQYSFQFYKETRWKLRVLFQQFEKQKIKRIVFLGIGELAEIAYLSLQETKISLVAIADEKMAGETFLGHCIVNPGELNVLEFDRILVTSSESIGESLKALLSIGIARNRIKLIE